MISLFRLFIFRVMSLSTSICMFFIASRRGHNGGLIFASRLPMVSFRVGVGVRASPYRKFAFFIIGQRLGN